MHTLVALSSAVRGGTSNIFVSSLIMMFVVRPGRYDSDVWDQMVFRTHFK